MIYSRCRLNFLSDSLNAKPTARFSYLASATYHVAVQKCTNTWTALRKAQVLCASLIHANNTRRSLIWVRRHCTDDRCHCSIGALLQRTYQIAFQLVLRLSGARFTAPRGSRFYGSTLYDPIYYYPQAEMFYKADATRARNEQVLFANTP